MQAMNSFMLKANFTGFVDALRELDNIPIEICDFIEEIGIELSKRDYNINLLENAASSAKKPILEKHQNCQKSFLDIAEAEYAKLIKSVLQNAERQKIKHLAA